MLAIHTTVVVLERFLLLRLPHLVYGGHHEFVMLILIAVQSAVLSPLPQDVTQLIGALRILDIS